MNGRMSIASTYHEHNDKNQSVLSSSDMLFHTFRTIDLSEDFKIEYLRIMIRKLREISKFKENLSLNAPAPMDVEAYMEILKKKEESSLKKTKNVINALNSDFEELCKLFRKEKQQTLHSITTIRARVNQYSDKWGWGKKEIVEAALESYTVRIDIDPEDTTDSAIEELKKMRQEIKVSLLNQADQLLTIFNDCKKAAKAVAKFKKGFDESIVDKAWVGVIEKLKEEPIENVLEYLEDMLDKLKKMRQTESKIKVRKVNKLLNLINDDDDDDNDDIENIRKERKQISRDMHDTWKTGRLSLDFSLQNQVIYEEENENNNNNNDNDNNNNRRDSDESHSSQYNSILMLGEENELSDHNNRDSGSTISSLGSNFTNDENNNNDNDSDDDDDDDDFEVDHSSLLELYPEKNFQEEIVSHKVQELERRKEKKRFSNALSMERKRKKEILERIKATKESKKKKTQRYREALEKGNKNSRLNSRNSLPCDPRYHNIDTKTKTNQEDNNISTPNKRKPLEKKNMNSKIRKKSKTPKTSIKKKKRTTTTSSSSSSISSGRASIYDFRMKSPGAAKSKRPFSKVK